MNFGILRRRRRSSAFPSESSRRWKTQGLSLTWSAVAAGQQVLRASREGLATRHEEPESIGQSVNRIERETDSDGILDLLTRDTGSQHRPHVIFIYRVLARQFTQHAQRRS